MDGATTAFEQQMLEATSKLTSNDSEKLTDIFGAISSSLTNANRAYNFLFSSAVSSAIVGTFLVGVTCTVVVVVGTKVHSVLIVFSLMTFLFYFFAFIMLFMSSGLGESCTVHE